MDIVSIVNFFKNFKKKNTGVPRYIVVGREGI